jgi:predicted Holliday junction resolvase-like endonuclease
MIAFYTVLILIAICAILVVIIYAQAKQVKKAKQEVANLHEAFWQVKEKAERLQKALGESVKVEEKANEDRKDLARTSDAALVDRANGLFLRDSQKRQ